MSLTVQIVAPADRHAAWRRWTDFDGWPGWNPACLSARAEGPLAPGTRLRLQLRHPHGRVFWTRPVVTGLDPEREIAWETRALGFRAPTSVRFEDYEDGTLVTLTSDVRGPLAFTYQMTFPEKTQGLLWSGALTGLAAGLRDAPAQGA